VLCTLEEIDGKQSAIYYFWFATLFARNDGKAAQFVPSFVIASEQRSKPEKNQ